VIAIGAVVALFLAAQTVFRIAYYGDILPNTYYLKMIGYPLISRIARGLFVAIVFLLPLLPLVLLMFYVRVFRGAPRAVALLATPLAGQLLYSIYVGGDAWEWWGGCNRYVAVVIPLFMILVARTLDLAFQSRSRATAIGFAIVTVGSLVLINAQNFPEFLMLAAPPQTAENAEMIEQALLVGRVTDSDATLGLIWAGTIPYFACRQGIDFLGKNDPQIAHEQSHIRPELFWWVEFWPGHNKWDYAYSIGEKTPDVVMQLWSPDRATLALLASSYELVRLDGFTWYLHRGSTHINHEALKIEIAHSIDQPRFTRFVINERR
jgi:arabinofuranosyltransferase